MNVTDNLFGTELPRTEEMGSLTGQSAPYPTDKKGETCVSP